MGAYHFILVVRCDLNPDLLCMSVGQCVIDRADRSVIYIHSWDEFSSWLQSVTVVGYLDVSDSDGGEALLVNKQGIITCL